MNTLTAAPRALAIAAAIALPATGLHAQQDRVQPETVDVYGSALVEGPDVEGIISARRDNRIQITADDGTNTVVTIDQETRVKGKGGFLGLGNKDMAADALVNGLPVSVETLQTADGELVASAIDFRNKDLEFASMIQRGTAQGFAEQTAATDALRSRVGDIDQYNVKGTTNVFFDTGKAQLSGQAQADLCAAAAQADSTDNALLLVVGYTDSTGDYEFNQELSEKRAARVVNYLQQQCGWKPYRMLTPTGMAEADPLADNYTEQGKAQNRRVAVNILVSKSVDGI